MDTTIRLTAPERRILTALARYQHLTCAQAVVATGMSRNSRNYISNTLTKLTRERGFLEMHPIHGEKFSGTPHGVWLFSESGLTYAAKAGLAVAHELPAYQATPSVFFRDHILAINNVLVGLQAFAETTPGVTLETLLHDHVLKRYPVIVERDGKGQQTSADWLVELTAFGAGYTFWGECDRGTEDDKQWTRKLSLLVRHAETLGPDEPFTVMVVVSMPEILHPRRRLMQLRTWTEKYLAGINRHAWGAMFFFAAIDPQVIPYGDFFTGPHWVRPFDETLYPLIDAPEEGWA